MSIDLKIHPKTVYSDIVSMPDPMLLGLTIHYYNHSDGALYMKIFGSGTGWSSNSVALGYLGTGANNYYNLDNFLSRAKPAAATTESITLTLKGYSDAGYTTEVYSFSRNVTVIFIKSDDGTWTTDFGDNFDDGTVQGWAVVDEYYSRPTIAITAGYVLSPAYSLIMQFTDVYNHIYFKSRLYKSFATPNKENLYAIINLRVDHACYGGNCATMYHSVALIEIKEDTTVKMQLGKSAYLTGVPDSKWIRLIIPLTKSATVILKIGVVGYRAGGASGDYVRIQTWLDDFKIISK